MEHVNWSEVSEVGPARRRLFPESRATRVHAPFDRRSLLRSVWPTKLDDS